MSPIRNRRRSSASRVATDENSPVRTKNMDLSPRKKARRSLVPRKSILKQSHSATNVLESPTQTTQYDTTALQLPQDATQILAEEEPTATNDLTDDRRKSRRVSFAPNAYWREFEKDPHEDSMRASTSSLDQPQSQLADIIAATSSEPAVSSAKGHRRRSSAADAQDLVAAGSTSKLYPSFDEMDQSMDMVSEDVTLAFRSSHFASSAIPNRRQSTASSVGDDSAMDMVEDDGAVTTAFSRNTFLFGKSHTETTPAAQDDNKEYLVPLGVAGVDEAQVVQTAKEKVKIGSAAFFNWPTPSVPAPPADNIDDDAENRPPTLQTQTMGAQGLALLDDDEDGMDEEDFELSREMMQDEVITHSPSNHAIMPIQEEEEEDEDEDATMDMDEATMFPRAQTASAPARSRASNVFAAFAATSTSLRTSISHAESRRQSLTATESRRQSITPQESRRLSITQQESRRQSITPEESRRHSLSSPRRRSILPGESLESLASPLKRHLSPPVGSPLRSAHPPLPTVTFDRSPPQSSLRTTVTFDKPAPSPSNALNVSTSQSLLARSYNSQINRDEHPPSDESPQEPEPEVEPESQPNMQLDEFLAATNVQFMQDMFSASKRKSIAPSGFGNGETTQVITKPTLADQIVAAGGLLPNLEMYHLMIRTLRTNLQDNQTVMDEVEADIEIAPPTIFSVWAQATDEQKSTLETQLKLIKNYYRLQVRNEWYTYRARVSESVCDVLERNLNNIREDRASMADTAQKVATVLPDLRKRKEQLQKLLEKERSRQVDLQECDQEHLANLKAGVAEQSTQLEDYKRDHAELEAQLAVLKEKSEEMAVEKEELGDAIENSRTYCDQVRCFTKAEVYRLNDELGALQTVHSWRLDALKDRKLELLHANEILISLALSSQGNTPLRASIEDLSLVPPASAKSACDKTEDLRRLITRFLFESLRTQLLELNQEESSPKVLLRTLTTSWLSACRLRQELVAASLRFPVSVQQHAKKSRPSGFLRVSYRIFVPKVESEFAVIYEITGEEIQNVGDAVIENVGCSVDVKFGNIDRQELTYIVRDRASLGGQGALLEACVDAYSKFA